MSTLRWPQVTMIVVISLGLYKELVLHGEQEKGKHNFWAYLFGAVIEIIILKAGGFF